MSNMKVIYGSKPNDPNPDAAEDDLCHVVSMIRAMVDNPNAVIVDFVKTERTIVIKMVLDKNDFGKIIGKQGKTINAIRTIVTNISAKHGVKAILELVE